MYFNGQEGAARSAALKLGYPALKPEQLELVVEFLSGRDAFVVDLVSLCAMEFFLFASMS